MRAVLIGVEGVGARHLRALRSLNDVRLVGVCDIDGEAARMVSEIHDVPGAVSAAQLLANADADVAIVATPPASHAELCRIALDAGVHVYCEKPAATIAAQAFELDNAARARGLHVQVGHQHRWLPSYRAARRILARLGSPLRAEVHATDWCRLPRYYRERPWRATWRGAGGGVLLNQAIHQLDLCLWLCGQRTARVRWAEIARSSSLIEVEDLARAELELVDGARVSVTASTREPLGHDGLVLHSEGGSMLVGPRSLRIVELTHAVSDLRDPAFDAYPRRFAEHRDVRLEAAPAGDDLIAAAHRSLAEVIRGAPTALVSLRDAAQVIEVVNAIYLAALEERAVDLPLEEATYLRLVARLSAGDAEVPIVPLAGPPTPARAPLRPRALGPKQ